MLSLKNINKTYADGTHALKQVSMDLGTGMVGLLGPNGAGKSSLMRTIATIQNVDSGSFHFGDINVLDSPKLLREQLGYLPQHFGVYPRVSCRDLLEHLAILKGLTNKAERHKQIDELLHLTNLSDVANKSVIDFSGGMLQRFGVAQALLGDPKVLILDEPTSGLDPAERLRLHKILHEVAKTRVLLLSTHIVEDIEHLCANTYILISGSIVASGPTTSLYQPLTGKIWQGRIDGSELPDTAYVLSESLQFGVPICRVYSDMPLHPAMEQVTPCLQDRYFMHLYGKFQGGI